MKKFIPFSCSWQCLHCLVYTVLVIEWPPVKEKIIARPARTVNTSSIVRTIRARVEFVSSIIILFCTDSCLLSVIVG
jgi:hypothetical protein